MSRRRSKGEGSISLRKDGRWAARISTGYHAGKRTRRWVYGETRADVVAKLRDLLHAQEQGSLPAPGRLTVEKFLLRWLEDSAKQRLRPRTFDSYAQVIRLHVVPTLGPVPLQKLRPQQVQAWLNGLQRAGLTPRTCQYARAILRSALAQAVRWGTVARNVATVVDPPRVPRHEIAPLQPEQARSLIEHAKEHRLSALFTVALALGLRQGEALGLQWNDIDIEAGTLNVRRALQRFGGDSAARRPLLAERKRLRKLLPEAEGTEARALLLQQLTEIRAKLKAIKTSPQFVEPKSTRSRRTVALPDVVKSALRAHRVKQLEERLSAGKHWREMGLVFTTTIGTPIEPSNLTKEFQQLLTTAGLQHIRFHDLRHTAATFLLAQGVDPRTIMETLGHSQISLTLNTYSHVLPTLQRDAAERMNRLLMG